MKPTTTLLNTTAIENINENWESYTAFQECYQLFLKSNGLSTDSRTIQNNMCFLALKGERFDGHDFIDEAIQKGACAIITEKPKKVSIPQYIVKNTLLALQQLAYWHRKQLNPKMIAISGSNGKTTTKELCYHLLKPHYSVLASPKNWNNLIGLPLTLLQLRSHHAIAVVELGDNQPGELYYLAHIADPDIGLITNIGLDHIGNYGTIEKNFEAKYQLLYYVRQKQGICIYPHENAYLRERLHSYANTITFGIAQGNVQIFPLKNGYFLWHHIKKQQSGCSKTHLPGTYNLCNIAASIAVALQLAVPSWSIHSSLATFQPVANRGQWIKKGQWKILLDAYNANPSSMEVVLKAFSEQSPPLGVILGAMEELGSFSSYYHEQLAKQLQKLPLSFAVLIGEPMEVTAQKLKKHLKEVYYFSDTPDFIAALQQGALSLTPATLLIKGSRKYALEKVVEVL